MVECQSRTSDYAPRMCIAKDAGEVESNFFGNDVVVRWQARGGGRGRDDAILVNSVRICICTRS